MPVSLLDLQGQYRTRVMTEARRRDVVDAVVAALR
jgi:hypothetical protein